MNNDHFTWCIPYVLNVSVPGILDEESRVPHIGNFLQDHNFLTQIRSTIKEAYFSKIYGLSFFPTRRNHLHCFFIFCFMINLIVIGYICTRLIIFLLFLHLHRVVLSFFICPWFALRSRYGILKSMVSH